MKPSLRLQYINKKTAADLEELWQNCFGTSTKLDFNNAYVPYPITEKIQVLAFLGADNGYRSWLIKRINEGDIIGYIVHGDFLPGQPNNIGYNIGLDYTRQGFATEAIATLLDHLREEGYAETFAHVFQSNLASIRTLEKCGFENTGTVPIEVNGQLLSKYKKKLS